MRSISSSRSSSSAWAVIETYSPAAIDTAPPMSPASPARRTSAGAGLAPAKPRTMATLDTSPSLTPNTAARAAPPWTLRWCFSGERGLGRSALGVGRGGRGVLPCRRNGLAHPRGTPAHPPTGRSGARYVKRTTPIW